MSLRDDLVNYYTQFKHMYEPREHIRIKKEILQAKLCTKDKDCIVVR